VRRGWIKPAGLPAEHRPYEPLVKGMYSFRRKNPTTTTNFRAQKSTPPDRQAREGRRQVIAACTFSLFTANIHPTPVSQPWQQAPREHPGKSSAAPVFTAAGGQVAATPKGQGRPDQAKPTNTSGGHPFQQHFPKINHPLQAKNFLKKVPPQNYRLTAIQHPPFREKQVHRTTRQNQPGTRPVRFPGKILGRAVRRLYVFGTYFIEADNKTGWKRCTFWEQRSGNIALYFLESFDAPDSTEARHNRGGKQRAI